MRAGFDVVGQDVNRQAVQAVVGAGGRGSTLRTCETPDRLGVTP